jgi:hypothetical protein
MLQGAGGQLPWAWVLGSWALHGAEPERGGYYYIFRFVCYCCSFVFGFFVLDLVKFAIFVFVTVLYNTTTLQLL